MPPKKRPSSPIVTLVPLDAIRLDGDTQPRVEINLDVVAEYTDAYREDAPMPPLDVFFDGTSYWLADGFHRWHGCKKADFVKVDCVVHQGTVEDARWFSYAANRTHGLNRTNADKAKAVQAALRHPAGVTLSNEQIAEHCGVDPKTVAKYRDAMTATLEIPESTQRTGRDGRTIETANIGRKPARPERDPESFQLGRCKAPGTEDCDCDACQELDPLPADQRRSAYQEACARFETQYPRSSEIRQVVEEWMEAVDPDASPEDGEEPLDGEDDSDVEEGVEEAPARPQAASKRSMREDLKRAVRDVWARYPETSAVTLQAYLVDLADECDGWAR